MTFPTGFQRFPEGQEATTGGCRRRGRLEVILEGAEKRAAGRELGRGREVGSEVERVVRWEEV